MLGWSDERPLAEVLPAKEAQSLARTLGLRTVGQLLDYTPRAWSKHGSDVSAEDADEGDMVTCVGTVTRRTVRQGFDRRTGRARTDIFASVWDGTTELSVSFFNAQWMRSGFAVGDRVLLNGKLKFYRGAPQLNQPKFYVLPQPDAPRNSLNNLADLKAYGGPDYIQQLFEKLEYLPVYPMRKGMNSWRLMAAVDRVLAQLDHVDDPLGAHRPADLPSLDETIRGIHQPDARGPEPFIERLKYNEAMLLSLVMAVRKLDAARIPAPACPIAGSANDGSHTGKADASQHSGRRRSTLAQLMTTLPYTLTPGQREVIEQIAADMQGSEPMSRLLQGEVGSGKTVVALAAMLQAVDAGRQAVLLAPTEVLATQHARSLQDLLTTAGLGGVDGVRVSCLTGSARAAQRKQVLLDIVSGEADVIVGTHALLYEGVEFFDLALVVVDEQHRFGVEQRDALRLSRDDGMATHMLVMTATPIPRTVAMTSFGDLAVSVLRELPGGRKPITTSVVPESRPRWVERAWKRIAEEVSRGRQAFVVCPRIEGEGGVEDVYGMLREHIFPHLRIGLVHGKLDPAEKDATMQEFAAGQIDVLVSTTVIEVGIDVPNATVMYIREADRFGVSQLHQLRGRVGRGGHPGLCLLHTEQPEGSGPFVRLQQVAECSDGFALAELDVQQRQEGDVLGTDQSGRHRQVRFLDLIRDADLISRAHDDAVAFVDAEPDYARELVSGVEASAQEFIEKS